jgi:hypothetical protein
MSRDIACRQCGEPWSEYALRHDVSEWPEQPDDARDKFMHGEGCPTCDWGDKAGDVSRSRTESADELEKEHKLDIMRNTDDDPIKFL